MKKFLRRMNRGIALAIILVVGLAAFLTIDSMGFSTDRDKISEMITAAIPQFSGMNVLPKQYNSPDVKLADEIKAAKTAENNELLAKYFVAPSSTAAANSMSYFSHDISDIYDESISKRDNSSGIVVGESAELARITSISKLSSGYAKVSAEINYTVEFYGSPIFRFLSLYVGQVRGNFGNEIYSYDSAHTTDMTELQRTTAKGSIDFIVKQTGDGWRFESISMGYFSSASTSTISGTEATV